MYYREGVNQQASLTEGKGCARLIACLVWSPDIIPTS